MAGDFHHALPLFHPVSNQTNHSQGSGNTFIVTGWRYSERTKYPRFRTRSRYCKGFTCTGWRAWTVPAAGIAFTVRRAGGRVLFGKGQGVHKTPCAGVIVLSLNLQPNVVRDVQPGHRIPRSADIQPTLSCLNQQAVLYEFSPSPLDHVARFPAPALQP